MKCEKCKISNNNHVIINLNKFVKTVNITGCSIFFFSGSFFRLTCLNIAVLFKKLEKHVPCFYKVIKTVEVWKNLILLDGCINNTLEFF